MHYEKRFLHRLQENFLIVGLHDMEELRQIGCLPEQFVELSMDALCTLSFFPNIKHLILTGGDLSPESLCALNGLKIRSLKIDYYSYEVDDYTLDLSCFPCLELVFARTQHCCKNVAQCPTLCTLIIQEWLTENLDSLADSSCKALKLLSGRLKSLSGVEKMPHLLSLSVSNQRRLMDCSSLGAVHLESLELACCNKIDLGLLPTQPALRLLHLSGQKAISNAAVIGLIAPNLEWLWLDHKITDGDLSPFVALSHAVIMPDRLHYSCKNCDLPKSTIPYRSWFLPPELEILPDACQ